MCELIFGVYVTIAIRKKWSQHREMRRSLSRPAGHVRLYEQLQTIWGLEYGQVRVYNMVKNMARNWGTK